MIPKVPAVSRMPPWGSRSLMFLAHYIKQRKAPFWRTFTDLGTWPSHFNGHITSFLAHKLFLWAVKSFLATFCWHSHSTNSSGQTCSFNISARVPRTPQLPHSIGNLWQLSRWFFTSPRRPLASQWLHLNALVPTKFRTTTFEKNCAPVVLHTGHFWATPLLPSSCTHGPDRMATRGYHLRVDQRIIAGSCKHEFSSGFYVDIFWTLYSS